MFNTLSQKALAGAVSMFALVAVCGGANYWSTTTLTASLADSAVDGDMLRSHLTADMMHDALRADVLAALVAASPGSGVSIADVKASLKEHADEFRASIAHEASFEVAPEVKAALAGVAAPLNAYMAAAERLVSLAETDPAGALTGLPAFMKQFEVLEGAMEDVTNVMSADATASVASANANADIAEIMIAIVIAAGLLIAGLLAFGISALFIKPVKKITDAMTRLAGGDESVEAPYVGRGDEISAMGGALAAFKQAAVDHREAQKAQQAQNETVVNESFGAGCRVLPMAT